MSKNKPEVEEYADEVPSGYNREGWEETKAWRKHIERQRKPLSRRSEKPETKKKIGEILYCHATRRTRAVGPGHWFFHTGQWAQCAAAGRAGNGQWYVRMSYAPFGKKLPEDTVTFDSIEKVQQFVSEYFAASVVKIKASDFPDPKNL